MADFAQQLAVLAQSQQIATGMVVGAIAGTAVFALKEAPAKAWSLLQDLLSVTLVVEGRDDLYPQLNRWLSRDAATGKAQRLIAQDDYNYEAGRWGWQLTLGRGWHLVWFERWPLFVHRVVEDGSELAKLLGGAANHRLWLISPGRSQRRLRGLIAEAERIYNGDGLVRVYFWHGGGYRMADRRAPRDLDTVFLPEAQKARVVEDVQAFVEARDTYRQRGTPYRRGYLFEGPPGTGKTSLIFALAGLLGRSVYVINLATVAGDNDLLAAVNEVGSDGVVVIEDIDAAEITKDRAAAVAAPVAVPNGVPVAAGAQRLTLSGLLNAIDGVASREGRVLFVTSNHPDSLDAALLRAGRIDVRERIAPLAHNEAWRMFRAFRPDASPAEFARLVATRLPMPAAELQNLLQSPEAADKPHLVEAAHG